MGVDAAEGSSHSVIQRRKSTIIMFRDLRRILTNKDHIA
jgi:hypothetical protein